MIDFLKSRITKENGLLIFSILLFLHILPLFSVDIIQTLDGPSHLHNAKLFNEIVAGNTTISDLFEINGELVPNYIGHLLLSFFIWVSTPILALKIVHLLYVVGIAISFRSLVLSLNPKGGLISLLIFPFIYSELFMYGFYNFSLAIVFLFITTRYWIVNSQRKDIGFYVTLALLFALTYFSHSFTFLLLCLTIGVFVIVEAFKKQDFKSIYQLGFKAFFMALPSIILSVLFVLKRESSHYDFRTSLELWDKVFNLSCLKKFDDGETFYFLWVVILFLSVLQFTRNAVNVNRNYTFLFLSIISIVLYFFMPDGIGYAGFFSVRLLYIALLFLIIWLSLQEFSKLVVWFVVVSVSVFQIQRLERMKIWSVDKNNRAKEIMALGDLIPENSIIKPIRVINVWQYFHLSNYLGVNKPQIILENYEATHDYFPVTWKYNLEEKNHNQTENFFKTFLNGKNYTVDYLVVIGEGKTEDKRELEQIAFAEKNFPKVYESYFVTLYKVEL